ncbi:cyanophycinase [Robertkochia aurantiaca]|uniref:cyanophycinase n=1 Tax=Robertkochia aurantiaca TaxID=2873700 RepID=UPI001CC95583|nr:cyanophycinase [Robertkochia sp. 3YJGBD-33]
MNTHLKCLLTTLILLSFISCQKNTHEKAHESDSQNPVASVKPKGSLFIIGGGKRPPELVREMISLSSMESANHYAVILPMSSAEPDSAIWYGRKQFTDLGITPDKIKGYQFTKEHMPTQQLDSLENAALIYITGGDQNRFMEIVEDSQIEQAIKNAYQKGSVIAGTSAGAAVMSEKMITGDQYKHPEYTGDFQSIESENIIIENGLGLTDRIIVDQHFIRRMRMNRLLSVAMEHPEQTALGIDESTAVIVKNDSIRVTGESQVIYIKNQGKVSSQNGLLGGDDLKVKVLLPGTKISL